MNPLLAVGIEQLIFLAIREFESWKERKQKPIGWTPAPEDIREFLDDIDAATPEAIKAQVAKELGLPWPPPPPPE